MHNVFYHKRKQVSIATSGKNEYSLRTRFIIGILSLAGVGYEIASGLYPISRSYYTELGQWAEKILNIMFFSDRRVRGIILVTDGFIQRCVLALSYYCRSPIERIVMFFDLVVGIHVSKGKIDTIRKEARQKALEYEQTIPLDHIEYVSIDEIFQGNQPILTGIDLQSGYAFELEPAKDRSGNSWAKSLAEKQLRGLEPKMIVSDGGSGLRSGAESVFPGHTRQLDVFHSLREMGQIVKKQERFVMKQLKRTCDLEKKVKDWNYTGKEFLEFSARRDSIDKDLKNYDSFEILYSWLKEYLGFTGYGYTMSENICSWILDEMAALYPEQHKFQSFLNHFRKRLPELLQHLRKLQKEMELAAAAYHVESHAFQLMYRQQAYPANSKEYALVEKRLRHLFRNQLSKARATLDDIQKNCFRASSMVENLNSRIRPFIDEKRRVFHKDFSMIRFFLNTMKPFRSRKCERKGRSALDRLTGKECPEFLDIVADKMDYYVA